MSYESWADVYDAIYSFKDYSAEAARILALPGRNLLDVGCGTGLHLQHLVSRFDCAGWTGRPPCWSSAQAARRPAV